MKPEDAAGDSDQCLCEQSHLSSEVLFLHLTAMGCWISDCDAGLQQTKEEVRRTAQFNSEKRVSSEGRYE